MLIGADGTDDAGVYLLTDEIALVQTVDFFTPIVDDPFMFGQIAAANSLSDVYAMGARPITALNIIAFPEKGELGLDVLSKILQGGYAKAEEAGVSILGGHSVDDPEPKFGMAITGVVHPDKIWKKSGAHPGDAILLTKPLGTGIIATGIKKGGTGPELEKVMAQTAATLNRAAAETAMAFDVHAATDVTGFGLINHLLEIIKQSRVKAMINISALPVIDGVRLLIDNGVIPGGTRRNLEFALPYLKVDEAVSESDLILAADAQTSGGLLLTVPLEQARELCAALDEAGALASAIIGRFDESDEQVLRILP